MAKKKPAPGIISNKRVRHDYSLADEFVVGISLSGREVKSLREGQGHLRGAYVAVIGGELWLVNATITGAGGYQVPETEWTRTRKLLAKKKEIEKFIKAKQQGLSILPLAILTANKYIKLKIALGSSKKRYDKRQVLKKRDDDRDVGRAVKRG